MSITIYNLSMYTVIYICGFYINFYKVALYKSYEAECQIGYYMIVPIDYLTANYLSLYQQYFTKGSE